jgi:hypothetical protein
MPRKIEKKERGVFEKEPGSEIWWIRYYIDGRERCEKVGRRGDAATRTYSAEHSRAHSLQERLRVTPHDWWSSDPRTMPASVSCPTTKRR